MRKRATPQKSVTLILILVSITSLVSGCASGPYPITSPYYQIPSGSRIQLTQTLTIPPDSARVYFQYGRVISPNEKDNYQPNCWFLSWKVLETAQTILPDTFLIKGSQTSQDFVHNFSSVKFASRSGQVNAGVGVGIAVGNGMNFLAGDRPIAAEYTTTLQIHSNKQPDIRRLACSHWDDPSSGKNLTVDQMQQALGNNAAILIDQ